MNQSFEDLTQHVVQSPAAVGLAAVKSAMTWTNATVICIAMYLVTCSLLRFRHEKAMRLKFNYPDRASLARMTNDDAQSILEYIMTYEFPFLYKLALQFAIFKTYGFPTMSHLIVETNSFADPATAPKRYEDTTVIFGEFSLNPPTSDRCLQAIARMNQLHSGYKKARKISNQDFLYTLSVCVTEPVRFMGLYEWRPLNDMEKCAVGTFWKSIGDAMEIEYKECLGNDAWENGLDFVQNITEWAKTYEVEAMRPHLDNRNPADALVSLMFYYVPSILQPFALEVMTVLMGDRVREAFQYKEPGILAAMFAFTALNVRWLALRFCALPRLYPVKFFSEPDPTTGRINHYDYLVEPWYNRPTMWSRWGPMSILVRLYGGKVPGVSHLSEGFLAEDLGPANKMGKGLNEMRAEVGRLKQARSPGCPFSVKS